MDIYPHSENDLTDVESRLSAWQPDGDNLHADAMLFAAGLAAGRAGRSRFVAVTVCGLLGMFAVGLGVWGFRERAERQALAAVIRERAGTNGPVHVQVQEVPTSPLPPGDYLSRRRSMELEQDRWLVLGPQRESHAGELPSPEPAILKSGQRNVLIDQ
jgi:hypothetical protein